MRRKALPMYGRHLEGTLVPACAFIFKVRYRWIKALVGTVNLPSAVGIQKNKIVEACFALNTAHTDSP
jgi:hypothetical protein